MNMYCVANVMKYKKKKD